VLKLVVDGHGGGHGHGGEHKDGHRREKKCGPRC
jgi:hypothetical protein